MLTTDSITRVLFTLCAILVQYSEHTKFPYNPEENDPDYWLKMGRATLDEAIKNEPIKKRAKNVILVIGDGFGMTSITATRILKGQKMGKSGEETVLSFEKFPNVAIAKTYNIDHQIPDSAGTATAFLTGIKSNYATIGVSGRVKRGDCTASLEHVGQSILGFAQDAGKATGIVTTSRVTHATPANGYAHACERRWENDAKVPADAKALGCSDIAAQIIDKVGGCLKVLMGGGRRELTSKTRPDEETLGGFGRREDERNIIDEWLEHRRESGDNAEYVWNSDQLKRVDVGKTDSLIGLFEASHMKYTLENKDGGDPSLSDMVETAIKILRKQSDGYVLLVEAARIDAAHHDNYASLALHEALELDKTVEMLTRVTSADDTMIIVTADHAHALLMHSYATRGMDILGLTDYTDDDQPGGPNGNSDIDGKPYTILHYGNGPGYTAPRENITNNQTDATYFKIQAGIPNKWVSHDGTDVPIYARGPMSHLLHSTHEQNYIFHVMKYATCLDEHKTAPHCDDQSKPTSKGSQVTADTTYAFLVVFLLCVYGVQ